MIVEWTKPALENLSDIIDHIAQDDTNAAHTLIDKIIDSAEAVLSEHPNAGRPGRVQNTREWVAHQNYVLAYRIREDRVQILAVVHSARLWPGAF